MENRFVKTKSAQIGLEPIRSATNLIASCLNVSLLTSTGVDPSKNVKSLGCLLVYFGQYICVLPFGSRLVTKWMR
jgi:hypothetical protein